MMVASSIFVPVVSKTITVTSGNAYDLAAEHLGDWTQVDRIMALNPHLSGDPWFAGVTTINLPPKKSGAGTGGIWGQ